MIVITGGAGFIGSAMVWRMNQAGHEDILVVDALDKTDKWKNLVNRRYADYMDHLEWIERVRANNVPFSVEAVVHMGACSATTERDADYLMRNNYQYTRDLAQWCIKNGVRLIYASSAATYGDGEQGYSDADTQLSGLKPLNMYGYSKQLLDLWALRNHANERIAGLKFFNVYGPNEYHKDDMRSVIHKSFGQILEHGTVKLFKSHRPDFRDGEQVRDFVYVKDVVEVIHWLLAHPQVNGIFNVGCGQARTWVDLVSAVFAAMGRERKIEFVDMPESLRDRYQYRTEAEMTKLRQAGFAAEFYSLEDGVKDYVQNYLLKPDSYL